MTARMGYILAGLAGVVIVVGLALIGTDLVRATETGPRWRRRLVAAALVLLGAVGMTASVVSLVENARQEYQRGIEDPNLTTNVLWTEMLTTWHEAEDIAGGKRGSYPFSSSGQKRFLGRMDVARENIADLCWRGLLSDAEAGLLKLELRRVRRRVQAMRTTDMKGATCYAPMPMRDGQDSMERLAARLPHLKKLAVGEAVQRPVLTKVMRTVTRDLNTLSHDHSMRDLDETERAQAIALRDAVRAQCETIQTRPRYDQDP